MKALGGSTATRAASRFTRHMVLLVAALVAVHIACHVLSTVQLEEQVQNLVELDEAGDGVDWLHWALLHQQVLLLLAQNRSSPGELAYPFTNFN
jgi:hypothetical protein